MSTVDIQVEQFKEMVRQEWTDEATVAAWAKWHLEQAAQTQPTTELLMRIAQPRPGARVLDVAAGTGALTARLAHAVGPSGHVTVTDLSAGMLAANEQNARKAGLTNVSFQQADAHTLKFPDQQFDLVTCRFGVMYFADSLQALKEIYRVLKPGGRAVFIAWGAMERNPFFLTGLGPFFKRVVVPPPPPGAPTPFKYAQEGTLATDLGQAGFKEVREEAQTIDLPWPGTPENLWNHFYDVAVPFRPVFDGLPAKDRAQAIGEVIGGFRQYFDGKQVNPTAYIIAATGIR